MKIKKYLIQGIVLFLAIFSSVIIYTAVFNILEKIDFGMLELI
ncbi:MULTISPECIES: hypothetical protein [unclassified Lebetimonas]|jgi:hypothetical protein|nr:MULTISPECIES: hypothetical protein [unclassified Lebetimonas]